MATYSSPAEMTGTKQNVYAKINELLGLDTDEFYSSYVDDPVLQERMQFIEDIVSRPIKNPFDVLISLGAFSMVEGAVLYSNFAFLKHFQAEGKARLMNLVAGINFSVRDEHLHSTAGAWLFQQLANEAKLSEEDEKALHQIMIEVAEKIYSHEEKIVDMIFERGAIRGITDLQLKHFVQSRLNLCLQQLGYDPIHTVSYNPIASWFYKNIQANQMHDFFAKTGNAYNRDWKESAFNWEISEGV